MHAAGICVSGRRRHMQALGLLFSPAEAARAQGGWAQPDSSVILRFH